MSAALQRPILAAEQDSCADVLRSPLTGARLHRDGPHSLAAHGERWPVLDGIAYLRDGRRGLVGAVLRALDAGDAAGATALLLQDRLEDGGEVEEPSADLRDMVLRRGALGFREAMRGLDLGYAAEVFAHRWSDPTFLSGLALAEAHWPSRPRLLDVGCGAGHFLRAAATPVQAAWGGDAVFAHLWLARHFVAPAAQLVCFDACAGWPFDDAAFDMVLCQDTLHLLADASAAVAQMRRVAGDGAILCGHVPAMRPDSDGSGEGWAGVFGPALLYDDAEMASALIARRAPRPLPNLGAGRSGSIAVAAGRAAAQSPQPVLGVLGAPPRGAALRRNPLYCEQPDGACVVRFPSPRYAEEVGRLATYPPHVAARGRVIAGADPADDALIRRRVWLDLPPRW